MITPTVSRRRILQAALATPIAALASAAPSSASEDGLHAKAQPKGLFFGCAVEAGPLDRDPDYRAAILRDAGVIVPTFEMKWGEVEPRQGQLRLSKAARILAFARANGLKVRGHAAIWHQNVPRWVPEALAQDGIKLVQRRVQEALAVTAGQGLEWDVLNEAIEPIDKRPDVLRNSIFLRALGPDYVVEAFRAGREADPTARLFYNEYGLEYSSPLEDARRQATLNLLRQLRERNLVDGLGTQSHLKVGNTFKAEHYRRFLSDVAQLGLPIVISELDVSDSRLPGDPQTRDLEVARHARLFLDVALDEPAVKGVVTWGISDRHTWLNSPPFKRADGLRSRSLPYDEQMQRKPLWEAIAGAFAAAPVRKPA